MRLSTTVARAGRHPAASQSWLGAPLRADSRRRGTRALRRAARRGDRPRRAGKCPRLHGRARGDRRPFRRGAAPCRRGCDDVRGDRGGLLLANNSGRVLGRIEMLAGDPAAAARASAECCDRRSNRCTMRRASRLSPPSWLTPSTRKAGTTRRRVGSISRRRARRGGGRQHSVHLATGPSKAPGPRMVLRGEAETLAGEAATIAGANRRSERLGARAARPRGGASPRRSTRRPTPRSRSSKRFALFERKGNRVSAEAARAMLTELTVA